MNLLKEITRFRYNIGFIDSDSDGDFLYRETNNAHVRWLDWNGYKGGWFADPFILSFDDSVIEVLVEEWEDRLGKGRISKLVIDRKTNKLQRVVPLLEDDTHFSFPNIWREDGKEYVYPENYQSGGLYIYEYNEKDEKLINPHCIVNEPLLDAQIVKYNDFYYLFGVRQDNGAKQCKILYIYKSPSLFGDYTHIQTIENQFKEERGAGEIFVYNNQLIRPAQSCEVDYGYSMVFYVLDYDDGKFEEKEVGRMYPNPKGRWKRKIHTYNRKENLVAVDGYEFVHRFLSDIYRSTLKKLL